LVRTAITHPGQTVADLVAPSNLDYWLKLLWPLGFASLFSPLTALIAAPELLLNALSATVYQRRIEFHYTALEIPFLVVAAVFGVMRLWRWLGGGFRRAEKAMAGQFVRRETLALLVLLAALAANYSMGPLPFSLPGAAYNGKDYARTAHAAALDEAVRMIPDGARVSANNNAGAQLAARRVAFVFPYFAGADWVLVDEKHPFFYDREDARMHRLALGKLVLDDRFVSVYAKDGVYVFKRVAPNPGELPGGAAPQASPSPSPTQ